VFLSVGHTFQSLLVLFHQDSRRSSSSEFNLQVVLRLEDKLELELAETGRNACPTGHA
jgi:hypothetical protein